MLIHILSKWITLSAPLLIHIISLLTSHLVLIILLLHMGNWLLLIRLVVTERLFLNAKVMVILVLLVLLVFFVVKIIVLFSTWLVVGMRCCLYIVVEVKINEVTTDLVLSWLLLNLLEVIKVFFLLS